MQTVSSRLITDYGCFCNYRGHGLRRFLADLAGEGTVAIPTLNSAGCDKTKMEEMDIDYPDFLEQQFEIITRKARIESIILYAIR